MQIDHGKDGTALGNVGQGDHRPEHGAVVVGDQLQVDGVGHVMQSRNDERSIDKAKDGAEHLTEGAGDTAEHHAGNERTDRPADGLQDKMCRAYGQHQTAEGNHNHLHHRGHETFEEAFQIDKSESR